jgi:outer membrane protein assembly factor BamA
MNKIQSVNCKFLLLVILQCCFFSPPAQNRPNSQPYQLSIYFVDKDSSFNPEPLKLQTAFADMANCKTYVNSLIAALQVKGYPAASVDTAWDVTDTTFIHLYIGKKYYWVTLQTDSIEKRAVYESGYTQSNFSDKIFDIDKLQSLQLKLLQYYERNGYPFAQVFLSDIAIDEDKLTASLQVNKGTLYSIDSTRVYGKAKISKNFLQHYLSIPNGSIYNKEKLEQVSKRILELPYLQEVQPSDITMLGNSALLNLYLAPKKSSQFNFLLGVLPVVSQTTKFQLTADVNLNLKNTLNNGETILFTWQQLQKNSPRLNLGYQHPFIFNSNIGFDFLFDLFKKDSTFLQLNTQLGLQYTLSGTQSGKIFIQWQNNFLLANGVDTNIVKNTRQLPPNIDVNAVNIGLGYEWLQTDYRLNPRRGNEVKITAATGIKNVKANNDILSIQDPSFNYKSLYDSVKGRFYQLRIKLAAAHYFPLGKQGTFKLGLNAGLFNSPNIFRNELFQIGGYRLLRGFDEESIYATQYAVSTAEYRYRIGLNSFLFVFTDAGWVKARYQKVNLKNTFISTGLGMAFETKFGLLNISYAMGKRNDVKFNIRGASKIHFGYVNYF